MQNDEHDTKQYPSGRKEPRGSSYSGQPHYQKYDDGDYFPSRGKQKTTIITLSLVTCLFMCVIGYEIIRENQSQPEPTPPAPPQQAIKERRTPVILSRNHYNDDSLLHNVLEDDDNYDNHQIRVLKEQNKQQAAKIRALRQELLDKMQNAHEIKANLFRQEGDPKDKVRIGELAQQLSEKDQHIKHLSLQINSLEKETADLQKKITQLEVTRDALATMMENQRANKEQETVALKKKIDDLNKAAEDNKSYLAKKVKILEGTQQHLADSLEQKTISLGQLEKEVGHHKATLSIKKNELQNLYNMFATSEEEIKQDILDLIANVQWEATSKAILEKNLQAQINDKSSEVHGLQHEVAKHKQLLETASQDLLVQEKLSNEQALNLIASLEWEVTWTQKIHDDLHNTIHGHTKTLQERSAQIEKLQSELTKHENNLSDEKRELLSYSDLHHFTHQQLQSDLEEAFAAYESEEEKALALQNELSGLKNKYDSLQKEHENVQKELAIQQIKSDEFNQQLTAKEFLIATQQLQLKSLLESHQSNQENSSEQIELLTQEIEEEESELAQLRGDLAAYAVTFQEEQENGKKLQQQLEQLAHQTSELDETLLFAQQQLRNKEDEIQILKAQQSEADTGSLEHLSQLAHSLDFEKAKSAELQQQLEEHLNSYNSEQSKITDLEEQFAKLTQELSDKETELHQTQEMLHYANPKLETLAQELSNKETELLQAQEMLQTTAPKLETLQQELTAKEAELSYAQDLLNTSTPKLEALTQELSEKEAELVHAQELLNDATPKLEALARENEQLQHDKNKAEELSKKYEEQLALYETHKLEKQSLEGHLLDLQEQLRVKEDHKQAAEIALRETTANLDNLSEVYQQLSEIKGKAQDFEQKYATTEAQLTGEQRRLEQLEEELLQLNKTLKQKEFDLDYAQNKLNETSDKIALLTNENRLLSQLKGTTKSFEQKFSETLLEHNKDEAKVKELESQIQYLTEKLQTSQSQLQHLSLENTQFSDDRKKIQDLQEEVTHLTTMLSNKEAELDATQEHIDASTQRLDILAAENIHLTEAISKAEEIEQQLRASLAQHKEETGNISNFDQERNHLWQQLRDKEELAETTRQSLVETQDRLNALLSEMNQISYAKQKHSEIEQKYLDIQAKYSEELAKQKETDELLNALADKVYDKEQELLLAEEKLQQITQRLESILEEKELLAQEKNAFESQHHSITSDHKEKIHQLNDELNNAKIALQKALMDFDQHKDEAQRKERRLQSQELKVSLLEEELSHNKATHIDKKQATQTLTNLETTLKSDFDQKLAQLTKEIETEKNKSQEMSEKLAEVLESYDTEQKRASNLQNSLHEATQIVSDLEGKIQNYKSQRESEDTSFGDRLLKVERDFEESQIVNASLQSELKSLLSQYLAEQERAKQLEQELHNAANRNHQTNEPTYYQIDEEVVEIPQQSEPSRPRKNAPSRLQRMNHFNR